MPPAPFFTLTFFKCRVTVFCVSDAAWLRVRLIDTFGAIFPIGSASNRGTYDYEDERVWILVAIGDTLFQLQQYSNAMEYLRRAYFYDPGNPFINLRLGQCELESDCILDAKEHLLKAYMAEGSTIFEGENLKYLQAIKRLIRH